MGILSIGILLPGANQEVTAGLTHIAWIVKILIVNRIPVLAFQACEINAIVEFIKEFGGDGINGLDSDDGGGGVNPLAPVVYGRGEGGGSGGGEV